MYVFAHVLAGVLLGIFFLKLTRDWRAIPVCTVGAILPDIIDKPLALLIPELASGRTIFHSLIIAIIVLAIGLAIFHYRHSLLGVAFAAGVISHQLLDSMWEAPRDWLFPVFGWFRMLGVPDYAGQYLWLELTNPAEWLFALGSLFLLAGYAVLPRCGFVPGWTRWVRSGLAVIFAAAGIIMTGAGLFGIGGTFLSPGYSALTTLMAGILALVAALALVRDPLSFQRALQSLPVKIKKP